MTTRLRIGFLPLIDAALLVVAREEGFAEQEGLSLDLVREASWANLRDRLSVGLLDAAQMLAPAAIAATLGLGHLRVPMAAPAMLSLNGASITVSSALFKEMTTAAQGDLADAKVAAAAFAKVAAARVAAGGAPPVLATVFAYSTHTLLIAAFLRLANLKPEADIPLVVLPPQYTAASLRQRPDRRLLRRRAMERRRGRFGRRGDRRVRRRSHAGRAGEIAGDARRRRRAAQPRLRLR